MNYIFCPNCDQKTQLNAKNVGGGLPPTGGDYDWVETETEHICPLCAAKYDIRVQKSLETGNITHLTVSPKPFKPDSIWYGIAYLMNSGGLTENGQKKQFINLRDIFFSLEEAQECKKKKYNNEPNESYCVLVTITEKGFFKLDGEMLIEANRDKNIRYHVSY